MKITMYELLGMIKDGKAPKKIKINNDNLTLSKTNIIQYNFERSGQLNWDYYIENYRLDEKIVEILEEEKKIPERVLNAKVFDVPKLNNMELSNIALTNKADIKIIKDTLNEVLDYLKSKGEK